MAGPGDHRLEELLTRVLRADPRVDAREIDVRVQDGIVYLSGSVDSAAERSAIEEDVEAAAGADVVVDDLMLRNFVPRTDDELAHAVKHALIRDATVDARPIGVSATNGVVTLDGRVDSYVQKAQAECIAWWTPGVVEVISHVRVDNLPQPPDEPDY